MKIRFKYARIYLLTAVILATCAMTASAKMYKWTDQNGKVHYSQTLPLDQKTQKLEELNLARKQKKIDQNCCFVVRDITDKMIIAQHKGATITDLYGVYHPQLGDLKELANYVTHKFNLGIEAALIRQMTFDTCMNAGFNLCAGDNVASAKHSSGSGFYINAEGFILTNHHVADNCESIRIPPQNQAAIVIASDAKLDLAILKTETETSTDYVRFRETEISLGEEIIVAGFPYRGELSSGINITTGIISALAGPKDDNRLIQITAPIQPGNSGGPVLDKNGNVAGIVVSKLNSLYFAEKYKDIPQNINFAIRADHALEFLNEHDISTEFNSESTAQITTHISQDAEKFTVVVECNRGNSD